MATNPERFYYVSNDRLALVEKGTNTTTVDGVTTEYITISEAKPLVVHAICRADYFTTGSLIKDSDYASSTIGPLGDIPVQFHEALVNKVIAMGYKRPPSLQLDVAQYFDNEYEKNVKEAKKFSRSNYTTTGIVSPVEF
jgi:hypothetical protein|tara:strand:- start:587 stop:1003 length:417 start_codon:yes stop_codon:yes gene_type:complete